MNIVTKFFLALLLVPFWAEGFCFNSEYLLKNTLGRLNSFHSDHSTAVKISGLIMLGLGALLCSYCYVKNLFSKNNKKPFELGKLPKDIQNEIASYLTFNNIESDCELTNILNKKSRKHKINNVITITGKKFKLLINQKQISITSTQSWSTNKKYEKNITLLKNYNIIDAEVSPNFKKLILLLDNEKRLMQKLWILDLKDFSQTMVNLNNAYVWLSDDVENKALKLVNKGYHVLDSNQGAVNMAKPIHHIAITHDGKTVAVADSMDIYHIDMENLLPIDQMDNKNKKYLKRLSEISDIEDKDLSSPENIKEKQKAIQKAMTKQKVLVDRLEFNKQGTKLGVKYCDKEIEIIEIPGKQQEKSLKEYFRQHLISNMN